MEGFLYCTKAGAFGLLMVFIDPATLLEISFCIESNQK